MCYVLLRDPNGNWTRNDAEEGGLFFNMFRSNTLTEEIKLSTIILEKFDDFRFQFRCIEKATKSLKKMVLELP